MHFKLSLRAFLPALLLALVTAGQADATVTVCLSGPNCQSWPVSSAGDQQFTELQDAFNHISSTTHRNTTAFVYLSPGLYSNQNSSQYMTISNRVWRPSCQTRSGYTGFRLANRTAPTTIQGTGSQPSAVQIWAKVPDHLLQNPVYHVSGPVVLYKIFHGLGFDSNDQVTLTNLSVISDGGFTENGAGDATIYTRRTDLVVDNSLVLANKGKSNCLRKFSGDDFVPGPVFGPSSSLYLDQEGIVVDEAELTLFHTVVGGNIHTGVMVLNGATANVGESLVRGNGWDSNHFQPNHSGHGITSFYHSTQAACFEGDTQVDVDRSTVIANTGVGVLLRGDYSGTDQLISDSNLSQNQSWGFAVTGGWAPGITELRNGSDIQALGNQYGSTGVRFEDLIIDNSSSITIDNPYTTSNVTGAHRIFQVTEPDGNPWNSNNRWEQLKAVGSAVGGQTRDCPSGF